MLKALRQMVGRMGLVSGLLLTLVFALPAFESHACADEPSPPVAEAVADTPADRDLQCPDCGPACANGCCHAPHVATAPDVAMIGGTAVFAAPAVWANALGRPLGATQGPERPPRA